MHAHKAICNLFILCQIVSSEDLFVMYFECFKVAMYELMGRQSHIEAQVFLHCY